VGDGGGVTGPDAGVAVGLQLQGHRIPVGLGLAGGALLGLSHLLRGAGQGLDVVAVLMGDDIGAGEIRGGGAELAFHLLPEREVEVHALVAGTVEGTHGGLAEAAAGLGALFVEHHGGRLVALQLLAPDVVDIGPDDIDESAGLVLGTALNAVLGAADAAQLAGDLLGGLGVDAEDEIADRRQHQGADAAARDAHAPQAAPVIDIAAASSALPAHVLSSPK